MTTLQAIGYTAAGGVGIAALTFTFFAGAVRTRSINIAPRATARSKDTIYNPKARRGKRSFFLFDRMSSTSGGGEGDKYKDKDNPYLGDEKKENHDADHLINECKEKKEVQYRGGPMFGWIPWTLSLSYDQLLNGVPGTGTRKGGMEGSLLKVNLDGIILLRFHALCLRVSILATFIALVVILPLNLSARCFTFKDGSNVSPRCNSSDYNITDYEQTTLNNIPSLGIGSNNSENWLYGWFGSSISIFGSNSSAYLGRLYAVVVFSWILVRYSLYLTRKEWVDCLALRRVYYLEGLHWENRVEELNATVLNYESDEEEEEEEERQPGSLRRRRLINQGKKVTKAKKKKRDVATRDPWIPHPEQRETVPNIELYSVLVGNIPSLPSEVAAEGDLESMGFSKKQSLDWQLAVTSTFFDQCVPNQPGFSSSVAAVTILPDAPKLAKAWRAWYRHVGLLRRLRFIRSLIEKKRYYEIDEVSEDSDSDLEQGSGSDTVGAVNSNIRMEEANSLDILFPMDKKSPAPMSVPEEKRPSLEFGAGGDHEDHLSASETSGTREEAVQMREVQHRINYYKDVFGVNFEAENEVTLNDTLLSYALEYGPEQTAVYSREFAQGAGGCCPAGCREERLHSYELKDLENLREEITAALKESFIDLKDAQNSNVEGKPLHEVARSSTKSDNNLSDLDDIKLPSKYDAESRLYHKTPTRFCGQDQDEGDHNDLAHAIDEHNSKTTTSKLRRYEQSLPTTQEDSLRMPETPSSGVISISNQGRFYVKESYDSGSTAGDDLPDTHSSHWARKAADGESKIGDWPEDLTSPSVRVRQRTNTGFSAISHASEGVDRWERVQEIIKDDEIAKGVSKVDHRHAFSGVWKFPTLGSAIQTIRDRWHSMTKHTKSVVEDFASESTFAVVTFTSRQAAIAARHSLADGRGVKRWTPVGAIPVPPLADAAAGDLKTCRGCCRPVTLTANPNQQLIRSYAVLLMLAVMFVFYTVPLSLIANFAAPENIKELIPGLAKLTGVNPFLDKLFQGFVPALLNCLFFSLCPIIFKAISNFGSNAISVNEAEYIALQYYWTFMVVTAFSGSTFAQLGLAYFAGKQVPGNSFTTILIDIAQTLPGQVSANWLNWIILRTFIILPQQYMLQMNSFLFQWLGWNCCRRCVTGGGPGGPIPYRIYIDSGVVFLCVVALAPVSPLVAPAALIYFLYCTPLWRRNCIYIYRPKFDTGGLRWPFLSDVLISSLCVAQVLLTTAMALKEAIGPAILSALPLINIILHRRAHRRQYLKSYLDCALLQTSQLDGWDNTVPTSIEKRDEYRKFLVDAHKAAYVPICIAGGSTAALTAEPALVVPHENDTLQPTSISEMQSNDLHYHMKAEEGDQPLYSSERSLNQATYSNQIMGIPLAERAKSQHFASVRRLRPYNLIDQGDSF